MYKKLFFIGASVLLLAACSAEETNTDTQDKESSVEVVESVQTETVVESSEETPENSMEIVLGQPMELGDYTVTFQSYSLGIDYDGVNALIINYDWVNNSEDTIAPFMSFTTKAFQDGVQTGDVFMVDGVDLGIGQSEVRPGATITGAQEIVAIDDLTKSLELEVEELFSFSGDAYTTILDLSTIE